jgi:N-acetylglutamate synthase-like GNAT family acetyltransferase
MAAEKGCDVMMMREASVFAPTVPGLVVRRAIEADQAAIVALVRSEHLNPNDLDWRRFVVAFDGQGLVGAVQLRANADGSQELGSLVVRSHARLRGVATQMVGLLLRGRSDRVLAVTRRANVLRFARWRFVPIHPREAPRDVRQRRWLGLLFGGVASLLQGRLPSDLVVLERQLDDGDATLPPPSPRR